ncbi:bifunctional nuclease family protein [Dissulfurimicrobium hydrothermale]|uniref:bifunctional nuclease family protein n=1 Tax=Dissulfurimicrobium hydrothermale TaxID=1750598 RepID=UPI001EDC2171|nr:bifunctional nuclease family protein [Dissulfurimicrobium hydrothermale]UKL13462.1 bifunctional nuclease family protein [Dissulfurimicrobium hydrothermale]
MANIQMYVHAITIDPDTNTPIVILKEVDGDRTLPIWIGLLEATAIATEMEKIEFSRPMTHDLIINLLNAIGAEVLKIEVSDLKDNTYFALITLKYGEKEAKVDARPSDAVAIALRAGAQIFVNESVIRQVRSFDGQGSLKRSAGQKSWDEILNELDPKDFKYKM